MFRSGMLGAALALATGCGGATAGGARTTTPAASASAPSSKAAPAPSPIERAPSGNIAGRWRIGCVDNQGEIVEFTVTGDKAVGRVVDPGAAARFGFKKGEEVFRLTLDPAGNWAGTTHWRGIAGSEHWDGVVLAVTPTALTATVTNEACYRSMERVR